MQPKVFLPSLFDGRNRPAAPAPGAVGKIRFLTGEDYPPFDYRGRDGALAGYNIDVARAICAELKSSCSIQARRWDNLLDALDAGEGDAIIASLKPTAATLARARFTAPLYLTPGRFIVRAGAPAFDLRPEAAAHLRIGVEAGSAHEAFLRKFFVAATLQGFADQPALRAALRDGQIDLAFGDGVSWAVWLNDGDSGHCCRFEGGPYLEPGFFGDGIGVAVRPRDDGLRLALNYALQRLDERGALAEIYLKYFPIGFY